MLLKLGLWLYMKVRTVLCLYLYFVTRDGLLAFVFIYSIPVVEIYFPHPPSPYHHQPPPTPTLPFHYTSTHPQTQIHTLTPSPPGLRNELFTRHAPAGHAISTTSVHPSWHATGIIAGFEHKLKEAGIVADPPSNVANAVVEQVVAGRSGQIFMPRSEERKTNLRYWPIWTQDLFLGNVSLNPFGGGRKLEL